ncbi:hypothetical protein LIX87_08140 [Weissella viridescens]|uniref:hypothetical protein n=1 Tax=Weissella viridescens TaxID=1629 RepID=UPI001D082602|nr:hypothetical protein [Weissella viridescens]MCB6840960.1 hypothetical protein [Weissella viridescens]MCB6847694.1 hypothetical protein [Weissella viridescens]
MAIISYFPWDCHEAEGYQEQYIGETQDFHELNLSDEVVKELIAEWQDILNKRQHITLRVVQDGGK